MEKKEKTYIKAIELLKSCSTKKGFVASIESEDDYYRVWARDSVICSLAVMMDSELTFNKTIKASLITLISNQHKYGQFPSNVNITTNKVSYGGNTGRVDPTLWTIIGFSQYIKRTGDIKFAKKYFKNIKKAMETLLAWEYNGKNLIYVPQSGDWADEYLQSGYILYDQLLYALALKEFIFICKKLNKNYSTWESKRKLVYKTIRTNFWIQKKHNKKFVYNKTLFNNYLNKNKKQKFPFAYFNSSEINENFDGFALSLALLTNVFTKKQKESIFSYINQITNKYSLIPAFLPVIDKKHKDYYKLKQAYSYNFRNKPFLYHNGGLWPMITGFFCAYSKDKKVLRRINKANSNGFPEYLHGKTKKPFGKKNHLWSGSATIMATNAINKNERVFL